MRSFEFYDRLTLAALFAVPVAPAFYFGWSTGADVYTKTQSTPAAVAVGIAAAFGLETAGIVSGHIAVISFVNGQKRRAMVAAAIMALYLLLGILGVTETISTGVTMFMIAPLVYVLVAMQRIAAGEAEAVAQQAAAEVAAVVDADRRAHNLKVERMRLKHEENLARIANKSARPTETTPAAVETKTAVSSEPKMKQINKRGSKLKKRDLIVSELKSDAAAGIHRSDAEIGRVVGSAGQYVGRVRSSLNGSL